MVPVAIQFIQLPGSPVERSVPAEPDAMVFALSTRTTFPVLVPKYTRFKVNGETVTADTFPAKLVMFTTADVLPVCGSVQRR